MTVPMRAVFYLHVSKTASFEIMVAHSFGGFLRYDFELEVYARKRAKNGVKLDSITREMGGDTVHFMMQLCASPPSGASITKACRSETVARAGQYAGSVRRDRPSLPSMARNPPGVSYLVRRLENGWQAVEHSFTKPIDSLHDLRQGRVCR